MINEIFTSPIFGDIRVIVDNSGKEYFCLVDVCKALGISKQPTSDRKSVV